MPVGVAGVALAVPSRETAHNQAIAGASATRILHSVFPTGTLAKRGGHTVRVLVADLAPAVIIEGQTTMGVADQAHADTAAAAPPISGSRSPRWFPAGWSRA